MEKNILPLALKIISANRGWIYTSDLIRLLTDAYGPTGHWLKQRHALQGCRQDKEHLPQPVRQHAKETMGVDIAQKLGLWHGQAVKADTERHQKVLYLREKKLTIQEIAEATGYSAMHVNRIIRKYKEKNII